MTWERDFLTQRAARRCMIFLLPMGKILFALFPVDMEIYLSLAISWDIFGVLGGCLAKFTDLLEETIEWSTEAGSDCVLHLYSFFFILNCFINHRGLWGQFVATSFIGDLFNAPPRSLHLKHVSQPVQVLFPCHPVTFKIKQRTWHEHFNFICYYSNLMFEGGIRILKFKIYVFVGSMLPFHFLVNCFTETTPRVSISD